MTRRPTDHRDEDPGVPEALPRTLVDLRERLGVGALDRLWVFPPLRRGRKERGLVVASLYSDLADVAGGPEDGGAATKPADTGDAPVAGQRTDRRRLVTVSYGAERNGLELKHDIAVTEEGEAPPELIPRVMEGVVRRAGENQADAREVEIERSEERFTELLDEFDPELFETEAP